MKRTKHGEWTRKRPSRTVAVSSPALAERAKESERAKEFSGIAFRGRDRRAWVVGTPFDVWEIIEEYRAIGLKKMLEADDIPEEKILLALGYYRAYSSEIEADINENRRVIEREMENHPNLVLRIPQK